MSGVRGLMAAADHIEARIVEAEKLRAALEEIKRLHWPKHVDDTDQDAANILVCAHCCSDGENCLDFHDHDTTGPACSTAEIIARAGL